MTEKEQPLVSVIMATFNEPARFIYASVGSILAQSYSNWELIIADDSTDPSTVEAIDTFRSDARVSILRRPSRMGFVAALNEGLHLARGKYIARMDGDDVSLNERLEKQVYFLEAHPEIALLGGCLDIIDADGQVLSGRTYPSTHSGLCWWAVVRSPFAHPSVMFRRALVEAGLYYDVSFHKAEDLELWLRVRNRGYRWANLPCKLICYRVVGDLGKKRSKSQWCFNYQARRKNLSLRYLPLDILSLLIVKIYAWLPERFFSAFYARENGRIL